MYYQYVTTICTFNDHKLHSQKIIIKLLIKGQLLMLAKIITIRSGNMLQILSIQKMILK